MRINLDGKRFRSISNSGNGEVGDETIFTYHQREDLIWAEYAGGSVLLGTLIGKVDQNSNLFFHYQHINQDNKIMTGKCHSVPKQDPDGIIRLYESWTWTCEDYSCGESVIEEIG